MASLVTIVRRSGTQNNDRSGNARSSAAATRSRENSRSSHRNFDESLNVRFAKCDPVVVGDRGAEKQGADSLQVVILTQLVAKLLRQLLETAAPLHQRQRLLGADSLYPLVEVGPDEHRQIDELVSSDPPGVEATCELDHLGLDGSERAFARQEFLARNGEKPDEPRRTEKKRVVILAGRGPHAWRMCHVRGLRLALRGRLDRRQAEQAEQLAGLTHHLPRQTRRHRCFRVRLRKIAPRQGFAPFVLVSLTDLAALLDRVGLTLGRRAVEHEHELECVIGNQTRHAIEEPGKMGGDPPRRVAEWRAVAETDERQKLIQLAVAVDGQRLSAQILERDRLLDDDGGEENTHERSLPAFLA